jgi:osmotically-inducible protein OsmY
MGPRLPKGYLRCVDPRAVLNELIDELRWDPRLDESKIVPSLAGGLAVLQGSVPTWSERCWAEEIAKGVHGVTAVQNNLEVRLTIHDCRSDETLQRIITEVIEAICGLPERRPRADVHNANVTLSGVVFWFFQKTLAEKSIRHIAGIRAIDNQLIVAGVPSCPDNARAELSAALQRHIRDCAITVTGRGSKISLRGSVKTCAERDTAIDLAWSARGITSVDDRLVVRP